MTRNYYKVLQLLQIVTVIAKCDRKLSQSVADVTKCDKKLLKSVTGITKCDNYYKVRPKRLYLWWDVTAFIAVRVCHLSTKHVSASVDLAVFLIGSDF